VYYCSSILSDVFIVYNGRDYPGAQGETEMARKRPGSGPGSTANPLIAGSPKPNLSPSTLHTRREQNPLSCRELSPIKVTRSE
jgi:hypothetical protein